MFYVCQKNSISCSDDGYVLRYPKYKQKIELFLVFLSSGSQSLPWCLGNFHCYWRGHPKVTGWGLWGSIGLEIHNNCLAWHLYILDGKRLLWWFEMKYSISYETILKLRNLTSQCTNLRNEDLSDFTDDIKQGIKHL